jgi:hypothetical protein
MTMTMAKNHKLAVLKSELQKTREHIHIMLADRSVMSAGVRQAKIRESDLINQIRALEGRKI